MIWAIVTLQKEGFHYWEDAPEEVYFLRNKHRHVFSIFVFIEQYLSEDRGIEYILFKHWLQQNIPTINGPESCEVIASIIKKKVEEYFENKRKVKVQIMEDNENGALIE